MCPSGCLYPCPWAECCATRIATCNQLPVVWPLPNNHPIALHHLVVPSLQQGPLPGLRHCSGCGSAPRWAGAATPCWGPQQGGAHLAPGEEMPPCVVVGFRHACACLTIDQALVLTPWVPHASNQEVTQPRPCSICHAQWSYGWCCTAVPMKPASTCWKSHRHCRLRCD